MGWGYKDLYVPNSDKTRANKNILEHRKKASLILGRDIKSTEVVHHIDENPGNNDLNNLMVFKSQADHRRFHSGHYSELRQQNNVWECLPIKYNKICPNCHKEFCANNPRAVYCSLECCWSSKKVVPRLPKEILLQQVIKDGYSKTGRRYGVSGTTIKKWCKKYGIYELIVEEKRKEREKREEQKKRPKKPVKKPVLQYSKDGKFIKEYPSTIEVARSIGHVDNVNNIGRCANGKRKTASGFIWKWK